MGRLIRLSRHRLELDEPPSSAHGDSDLVPLAIILWIGSVLRVVAGAVEGEVMRSEATLALLCVVLIPCWLVWSWVDAASAAELGGEKRDNNTHLAPGRARPPRALGRSPRTFT